MATAMQARRSELTPLGREAAVRCPVCDAALRVLCDESAVRQQRHDAFAFHRRRLERRSRAELNERALFTQDDAVPLLDCPGCGLVSRWQIPDAAAMRETYAQDTYPEDRLVEMLAAQVSLFRRKVPVLRHLLGRPRRILEIGSFVGGFLDVAHTVGWDAIGVDPGEQLVEWCRERGRRVYAGTLEEFAAQHSVMAVDCLAIWNTFDQLPDPRPTLALAARFLTKGGVLAIRVPHGDGYRALLARREAASPITERFWTACLAWNNLLSFPHLYGYGLASLDRLVDAVRVRARRGAGRRAGDAGRARHRGVGARRGADRQASPARADPPRRASDRLGAAPWLDVYWRRV